MNVSIPDGKNEADRKLVQAKRQLETLMIKFNQLLQEKMLNKNKSQSQLAAESDCVMRLLVTADELDSLNLREGTYSLMALMVREGFVMRDNNNELAYEISELRKEINHLKLQVQDSSRVR